MSLEAAMVENTAALLKVAGLLEASNAGREAAVAAITQTEAPGTVGRQSNKAKAAKEAAEKAAAELAAAAKPAETAGPSADAIPDIEALRNAARTYLTVDEAGKPARKAFLKAVTDHLGINQLVDAAEGDRAKIIGWFEAAGRGETVNFSDGEDDAPAAEDDDDIG